MDVRFPPIRTAYSAQKLPEGRRVGVYQGTSQSLSLEKITPDNFMTNGVGRTQVAYWMPTARHLDNMSALARSVAQNDSPLVVDIGGANGFLGYLLAQRGLRVLSVDPDPRFLTEGYQHPNLRLVQGDSSWAADNFKGEADLAIMAWSPKEVDIIPDLFALGARAGLLVLEPGQGVKVPLKPEGYKLTYSWQGPSVTDITHLYYNDRWYFASNRFLAYLRADQEAREPEVSRSEMYPWEVALENDFRGTQAQLEHAAQIQRINV